MFGQIGCMSYRLVDVSCWIDAFRFPGDQPVVVTGPFNHLSGSNPEYVHHLCTPTQAGTHVQGPRYFLAEGDTIDAFPLDRFEGEAVLVEMPQRGEDMTLAQLQSALAGRSLRGRILLLRSGHMQQVIAAGVLDPDTRPGLSLAAAQWLADESGVGMVAIDSVGVESRRTADYEVNVTLCRGGVLILEGLVNLAGLGAGRLWLEAFPLKVRGVEGTPCRAVVKEYAPTVAGGRRPDPRW
jgi:kynurenine formamidase